MVKKISRNIGALLLEKGIISQAQWEHAKLEEGTSSEGIQKSLIRLGYVTEDVMVNFISDQMNIPRIGLDSLVIDPKIIELIPEQLAQKYHVIPLFKTGSSVTCAMADIFNVFALDEIALKTGLTIEPAIATEKEIKKALTIYYSTQGHLGAESGVPDVRMSKDNNAKGLSDAPQMLEDAPVIKFVNLMITKAVALRASDIHIEPEENIVNVRYRIDGFLYVQPSMPKSFQLAINSRIKIMANLNISETRRPQDGRFQMTVEDKEIDVRLSCLPTVYGENLVLRILNTSSVLMGLEQIGFQGANLDNYKSLLFKPNGIILVTGPTGSGKTTTLYSSISTINNTEKSIFTTEDPVEYRLPGIRQTQVDPQIGLTFASGLRAILRQDPNIIMVGEIRDAETAQIAIQAALTGHLVMATLHTNSAAGAISRLIDIGVEPFLLASSIIGVVGQRLVRLTCLDCKGKGCALCVHTGYKGRRGIYELMVPDERIRTLIMQRASTEEINNAAIQAGMKNLRDNGLEIVMAGLTTKEEIFRVTQ
jgi:type IV pilus assembly protein PilB